MRAAQGRQGAGHRHRSRDPGRCPADLAQLTLQPEDLALIIEKTAAGDLHSKGARELVRECLRTGAGVEETVSALGLDEKIDDSALEGWCREALEANPRVIEEVRAGKDKALGACIGPVMKASGGKADPKRITEVLKGLIEKES